MKRRHLAVLLAWFMSGCAATQMQSIHREAGFDAARIHKVLIVSLARTPEIRKLVEDEFVRQWKERRVEAVASYAVLPPNVTLDKAGVAPFARAQGFDSVMVNRLIKREAINRGVHVRQIGEPEPDNETMSQYFDAVVATPENEIPYEVAVLTTNLYDVATEKKMWSGVSHTLVTGDVPQRIRPFTKIILKNLYSKEGK